MPLVYQATNMVNGKRYIGVTKATLRIRVSQHFAHAKRGTSTMPFLAALRKHGKDAFEWRALETQSTYEEALTAEKRLIAEHRPEYNITAGGGRIPGKAAPGTTASWGKYRHLGPATSSRMVACITDGEVYPSAAAAARAYGVAKSSIIELCRGQRRLTVRGRVFRYEDMTADETAVYVARQTTNLKRKLTLQNVADIRKLSSEGVCHKDLALMFSVHRATISDVKMGKTWRTKDV